MKHTRFLGTLSVVGGVSTVPLFIAFAAIGWSVPGTAAYARYELLNRITAVSLLLMLAGWVGLALLWRKEDGYWRLWLPILGSILTLIGNASEFWLFSDLPYDGFNMRGVAWTTFLVGLLLLAIGATITGLALRRNQLWPDWLSMLLMAALPLTVIVSMVSPFMGPAVLASALGWVLLNGRQSSIT